MNVYTYSEARQHLAELLNQAQQEGQVRIRRRDGQVFVIMPERATDSPLNVPGVDLPFTTEEIVSFVHEGRQFS